MRRLLIALLSLLAVTVLPTDAQTKADEEVVRKLPQAFSGPSTMATN